MLALLFLFLLSNRAAAIVYQELFVSYHDLFHLTNNFLEVISLYSATEGLTASFDVYGLTALIWSKDSFKGAIDMSINDVMANKYEVFSVSSNNGLSVEVNRGTVIEQRFSLFKATAQISENQTMDFTFPGCLPLGNPLKGHFFEYACGKYRVAICYETADGFCRNIYHTGPPSTADPSGASPSVQPSVSISFPNAQPGLKNLTATPLTSENVGEVLMDSLLFSKLGSELTTDDTTALSLIFLKASMIGDISHYGIDVATFTNGFVQIYIAERWMD
ncbi:hypothetical protein QR680_010691 [Steinernema hermaphroditum]|uniref:Uncharacterized protein n=1 Tax=Steinernema hermaphroditum TaxID=289476 RepID=A0AA39IPU1_9BILA|nr:hypothetical protein QR680_010691 [Steinernema hermaphroditum]